MHAATRTATYFNKHYNALQHTLQRTAALKTCYQKHTIDNTFPTHWKQILQHTATHYNTHCNTHTALRIWAVWNILLWESVFRLQQANCQCRSDTTAAHYNTCCNTLQHTALRNATRTATSCTQHLLSNKYSWQHTEAHCNTRCNTLQHTATHTATHTKQRICFPIHILGRHELMFQSVSNTF